MACTNQGGWDIILAANDFSVLAGVLAGFVITAATILFASSGRYAPYTLALFSAGVPALALSSYIFSAISGVEREPGPNPEQCAQVWSQGVVATAMLTVGGAVLICGLGWVLVTYAEEFRTTLYSKQVEFKELAHALKKDPTALKLSKALSDDDEAERVIVIRRRQLVSLQGWFFGAATTMALAILLCANMVYVRSGYLEHNPSEASLDSTTKKWGVFFVVGFALFLIVRSAYTVIRRNVNARRKIKAKGVFDAESEKPTRRLALDSILASAVAFVAAWLSGFWKDCKYDMADACSDWPPCRLLLFLVLTPLIYVLLGDHLLWRRWFWRGKCFGDKPWEEWLAERRRAALLSHRSVGNENGSDTFNVGRLLETAANVALFAMAGTLFALLMTQTPLEFHWRNIFTLILGLIYPARIILGLARSTAAATQNYAVPPWIIMYRDRTGKPLPGQHRLKNFTRLWP